jgi:molybdate/tungstate transport system substrate-binding protein
MRRLALFVVLVSATGCKSWRKEVVVLVAASLTRAMVDLEQQLEQEEKALDIRLEISGSQIACRKVAEMNRRADVVATADYRVIDSILRPNHARFTIRFATNAVVLAHLEHSRYTDKITADNWPKILLRDDVRMGLVDPDLAPMGYRTLLVWALAARQLGMESLARRLRARVPPDQIVPHEAELMQRLQARTIDYAFVYQSTAEEHNLKTVLLPETYNLGAADRAEDYGRAAVSVHMRSGQPAKQVKGEAVIYGVTILHSAPNPMGAASFVHHLLGDTGQRVLKRTAFRPLVPARCDRPERLPATLRSLVR